MRLHRSLMIFLWLLMTFSAGGFGQENDSIKQAAALAQEGLQLVDKGNLDKALALFRQGALLDPNNSKFQYEIAVIFYLKKELSQSIQMLEQIKSKPDANDQYYQILGNAYDLSGQTTKARKTYADGLKRFPNSGFLYLESGVLEYMHKNTPGAVRFWESGVIAAPGFTSNYYWLAKYYASTTERVWAVMYGEMFINLERNTERTQDISDILNKVYRSSVTLKDSVGIEIGFTKSIVINPAPGDKLPFEHVFQTTMNKAADSLYRSGIDSIGYNEICSLRGLFLFYWYNTGNAGNYPNILFEWIHNFPEPSYLECYHRWLFLKGNESQFQVWYYAKPEIYGAFVKWFKKNPLGVNTTHFFSRSLY
jgi:tetratricopeptide (TPR) repeat protein